MRVEEVTLTVLKCLHLVLMIQEMQKTSFWLEMYS